MYTAMANSSALRVDILRASHAKRMEQGIATICVTSSARIIPVAPSPSAAPYAVEMLMTVPTPTAITLVETRAASQSALTVAWDHDPARGETELFAPLMAKIAELSATPPSDEAVVQRARRIIADHLRTATFIVACQRILHAREMRGLYP